MSLALSLVKHQRASMKWWDADGPWVSTASFTKRPSAGLSRDWLSRPPKRQPGRGSTTSGDRGQVRLHRHGRREGGLAPAPDPGKRWFCRFVRVWSSYPGDAGAYFRRYRGCGLSGGGASFYCRISIVVLAELARIDERSIGCELTREEPTRRKDQRR